MILIARAITPRRTTLSLELVSNILGREKVCLTNSPNPDWVREARAVILISTREPVEHEDQAQAVMSDMAQRTMVEKKLWVLAESGMLAPNRTPSEQTFTSVASLCAALFPTK